MNFYRDYFNLKFAQSGVHKLFALLLIVLSSLFLFGQLWPLRNTNHSSISVWFGFLALAIPSTMIVIGIFHGEIFDKLRSGWNSFILFLALTWLLIATISHNYDPSQSLTQSWVVLLVVWYCCLAAGIILACHHSCKSIRVLIPMICFILMVVNAFVSLIYHQYHAVCITTGAIALVGLGVSFSSLFYRDSYKKQFDNMFLEDQQLFAVSDEYLLQYKNVRHALDAFRRKLIRWDGFNDQSYDVLKFMGTLESEADWKRLIIELRSVGKTVNRMQVQTMLIAAYQAMCFDVGREVIIQGDPRYTILDVAAEKLAAKIVS